MDTIIFKAEKQFTFCQYCQRKFERNSTGIIYDYYRISTNLSTEAVSEEEIFEIVAGYMLHHRFEKNPQETCFKLYADKEWSFSFRCYRSLHISIPEQEELELQQVKQLFQKYLNPPKKGEKKGERKE